MRKAGARFAKLRMELQDDYLKGSDHMPVTIDEAYNLLESHQGSKEFKRNVERKVSFSQLGDFP